MIGVASLVLIFEEFDKRTIRGREIENLRERFEMNDLFFSKFVFHRLLKTHDCEDAIHDCPQSNSAVGCIWDPLCLDRNESNGRFTTIPL